MKATAKTSKKDFKTSILTFERIVEKKNVLEIPKLHYLKCS